VWLAQDLEAAASLVVIRECGSHWNPQVERALQRVGSEHCGIARLLGTFDFAGQRYAVFEFISGARSLQECIDDGAPFSERASIAHALGLAEVVTCLHAAGLVHGDLKPSNILITRGGQLKVIDFSAVGLSGEPREAHSTLEGTAGYTPPERYHGHVSPKGDVYSLGVVLYCMLVGWVPSSRFGLPPIQRMNPAVSRALAELIHTCLDLDPDARPSAGAVHRRLAEMAGGGG
jgi:serine/threonine protein kinase